MTIDNLTSSSPFHNTKCFKSSRCYEKYNKNQKEVPQSPIASSEIKTFQEFRTQRVQIIETKRACLSMDKTTTFNYSKWGRSLRESNFYTGKLKGGRNNSKLPRIRSGYNED